MEDENKHQIFVAKLGMNVSDDDLKHEFKHCGEIRNCFVKGSYGFIEFADESSVQAAIDKMHGANIGGNSIVVEKASCKLTRRTQERKKR